MLEDDERYERLTQRIEELEDELNDRMPNPDGDDFAAPLDDVV